MGSLNRVTLIGNLGRDAEMRYTPGGHAVATFNLATTESWKDKESGQKKEQTEWHRVVVWGRTAEALQEFLVKGKQVCVEGQLQTRKWEKDGQTHWTTEVKARNVVLLGGGVSARRPERPVEKEYGGGLDGEAAAQEPTPIDDDEIPF